MEFSTLPDTFEDLSRHPEQHWPVGAVLHHCALHLDGVPRCVVRPAPLVAVGRRPDRLGMTMDDAMPPIDQNSCRPVRPEPGGPAGIRRANSIPLTFSGIPGHRYARRGARTPQPSEAGKGRALRIS